MRQFGCAAVFVLLAGSAAAQPAGTEFRANSYTTGTQLFPAVASDANGNFVVVWESMGQDGNGYGIFGQRFGWPGVARGSEFQVNTTTFGHQQDARVAADVAGNFVVVWQDGDIHARRFTATGAPLGSDFVVNSYTTGLQTTPSVASAPDGRAIVVWASNAQDGAAFGVFGQRFDASGAPYGTEFRVNTQTTGGQGRPSVAMDRSGNFVVVWNSNPQDGSSSGIFGQRFDAIALWAGPEFRVNSYTTGYQGDPKVAADVDGNFVVVWNDGSGYDGAEYGVFAKRYDSAGAALGGQFRVNTHTPSRQVFPAVAAAADGRFAVVWQSPHDGGGDGVFGQLYNSVGAPQGVEFRANTYINFDQEFPAVASNPDGDLIVAWQSLGQQSGIGIYGQRFGDLIFQDGFETGGTGNWSSASLDGDLTVSGPAALASTTYGLQATVNDLSTLAVRDDTPNNEGRYHARFYFDTNSFDPGEASGHLRVRLCIVHNAANQRLVTIVLRRQGGAYGVAARGRRDDGTRVATAFFPITDAPHRIEFDWRRSTAPGANNGLLYLYVDGFLRGQLDSIDNDLSGADYVRLGAMSVKTGASGTLRFDQFESRRVRYIGLEQ